MSRNWRGCKEILGDGNYVGNYVSYQAMVADVSNFRFILNMHFDLERECKGTLIMILARRKNQIFDRAGVR